jgi:hypothetical protein
VDGENYCWIGNYRSTERHSVGVPMVASLRATGGGASHLGTSTEISRCNQRSGCRNEPALPMLMISARVSEVFKFTLTSAESSSLQNGRLPISTHILHSGHPPIVVGSLHAIGHWSAEVQDNCQIPDF